MPSIIGVVIMIAVAIDGPAGAGKSTIARRLATKALLVEFFLVIVFFSLFKNY